MWAFTSPVTLPLSHPDGVRSLRLCNHINIQTKCQQTDKGGEKDLLSYLQAGDFNNKPVFANKPTDVHN